jgi:hypothetical protein
MKGVRARIIADIKTRIRNKINFLQNFVDEFDIIVLTETHLDNSIENRDIELDSFDKNPQRKQIGRNIVS